MIVMVRTGAMDGQSEESQHDFTTFIGTEVQSD